MENPSKKYLFASYTNFESGKLTGAHRRFLELLTHVAADSKVTYVGHKVPMLENMPNVCCYELDGKAPCFLPTHLGEGYLLYKKLCQVRKKISWDYAVSFNPMYTICYRFAGYKHIVSLFREDLIGYQKALSASSKRLAYFQLQERLAVKASEKIIVQCANDRNNLISRNEKSCPGVADKVFIQINNANASWMNTGITKEAHNSETPKILFIGNFSDRRKGHFFLLPVAMRLLDEGYRFELLCAGGGRELDLWKNNCENYPLIQFLGQVNGLKSYLAQCDMMLVPSLIDSCPNTVLEGLNAGLAVYGTNTGGIPDLLQNEEYLFEPDENSVYDFLRNVLDTGRYVADAEAQKARKLELTFDWGARMQNLIEEK